MSERLHTVAASPNLEQMGGVGLNQAICPAALAHLLSLSRVCVRQKMLNNAAEMMSRHSVVMTMGSPTGAYAMRLTYLTTKGGVYWHGKRGLAMLRLLLLMLLVSLCRLCCPAGGFSLARQAGDASAARWATRSGPNPPPPPSMP